MYLGNFDHFDFLMCVTEHYGTEHLGKRRTESNSTQDSGATSQARLRH